MLKREKGVLMLHQVHIRLTPLLIQHALTPFFSPFPTVILYRSGTHPTPTIPTQTLLMVACKYGRVEIIKMLLTDYNSDINMVGGLGRFNALHYAAWHGHPDAIQYVKCCVPQKVVLCTAGQYWSVVAREPYLFLDIVLI